MFDTSDLSDVSETSQEVFDAARRNSYLNDEEVLARVRAERAKIGMDRL